MQFSYRQFEFCAHHLLKVSENIGDTWTAGNVSNIDEIFLKKFVITTREVNDISRIISWEYNIIFSHSYSAPVFYFNACFESGKLLSLENVETLLVLAFRTQFVQNRWKYLSQLEHPYERRPFFTLHPCNTEDYMKEIFDDNAKVNPLVTWLSSVASVIGLKFDLDYGKADFDGTMFDSLKSK